MNSPISIYHKTMGNKVVISRSVLLRSIAVADLVVGPGVPVPPPLILGRKRRND